jgi:SRSO17 transposase
MRDAPNKSIETMMLKQQGDQNSIRAMQHFITEGTWDDEKVLARHASEVTKDLGEHDGVLIVDGSDFPKQGSDSVGVKRQYCGQLGKVSNCQAGVFLSYASRKGYTLLDRRLYLPEEWLSEPGSKQRREACGVPAGVSFKTKPELALEMVSSLTEQQVLPCRWLTCDAAFSNPAFLDASGEILWYLAEVTADTRVWQSRPKTGIPSYSGRGRKPTRERLLAGEAAAMTVSEVAQSLPSGRWQRQRIKEGTKGRLQADFALVRVVSSLEGLPDKEQVLVLRRAVGSGELKIYFSNAPASTPMREFARVSGMRWPIESCFEEGKQELGMGDYQVRSWRGWHHHLTLVILAHFFVVRVKLRLKKRAPKLTLPQALLLMKATLPQDEFSVERTIEVVNYYQERHQAAELSHRKRRQAQSKSWE